MWISIPENEYKPVPSKRKFNKVSKQLPSKRRAKRRERRKQKRLAKQEKLLNKRPKYDSYIHSNEWQLRRLKYWKDFGKNCKACGSVKDLVVHHMHYGFLGRERDEDLVGLCWNCHGELHDEHGTKNRHGQRNY
jgi:hypothetical protein